MNIHQKLTVLRTKMTISRKIIIWKIWNLIFLSIQMIPHLSCEFEHFWRKKIGNFFFFKYWNTRETAAFGSVSLAFRECRLRHRLWGSFGAPNVFFLINFQGFILLDTAFYPRQNSHGNVVIHEDIKDGFEWVVFSDIHLVYYVQELCVFSAWKQNICENLFVYIHIYHILYIYIFTIYMNKMFIIHV